MFVIYWRSSSIHIAFAAAVLAVGAAMPGLAEEGQATSVVVSSQDLDLKSREGVSMMRRRLEAAARQVCGWQPTDLVASRDFQACRKEALSAAAAQAVIAADQEHRAMRTVTASSK